MYMSQLIPGFGTTVPRVWEGESDAEALCEHLVLGQHEDIKPWIAASVKQLCCCFSALLAAYGPPDPNKPIARKLLVQATMNVAVAAQLARTL